jgi:uncharacterized LabA/DUF88 family protein
MENQRVLLAIDANNLFASARQNGCSLSYGALLAYAASLGRLTQRGVYVSRRRDDSDRSFLLKLKSLGFDQVVARYPRQCCDGRCESDIDTALTMDVWEAVLQSETDIVILVSGDSDFVPLVERIRGHGASVWVIGPTGCTAWELKIAATHFVDARDVPGLLKLAAPSPEPAHVGAVDALQGASYAAT